MGIQLLADQRLRRLQGASQARVVFGSMQTCRCSLSWVMTASSGGHCLQSRTPLLATSTCYNDVQFETRVTVSRVRYMPQDHSDLTDARRQVGAPDGGRYRVAVDSDAFDFGGAGRVGHDVDHFTVPEGVPGVPPWPSSSSSESPHDVRRRRVSPRVWHATASGCVCWVGAEWQSRACHHEKESGQA